MNIKSSFKRKIIQFIAFVLSNPYINKMGSGNIYKGSWKRFCNPGLNCYSCPAARFACPIGAMQAVNGSMDFSWSFYIVGSLCAFGILFGRAVCGFLCPFGLLQELIYKIPFPKCKRKLPGWLKYIKYGMLLIVVLMLPVLITNATGMGNPYFCKYICPAGTIEGGIPLLLTNQNLRKMAGGVMAFKIIIAFLTIAGCLMISRFFCKILCPLGAFYGFFNKISFIRLETDRNSCESCGKCSKVCPMDVDPSVNPNSPECIRCGKCIASCHKQAIHVRKPSSITNNPTTAQSRR